MKAIVLAGGFGTRLRPVTGALPKPLAPLVGRPILEHILLLLKKHGFTQVCLALGYGAEAIRARFAEGLEGLELCFREEKEPLGTAGAVGACREFIGDEDVLVISGDVACDFDLGQLMARHRERGAAATLALVRDPAPLRFGLAVTDPEDRIRAFIEKPDWPRVVTDLVNTGIYVLSPRALAAIPEGRAWDFGKDLFPVLLKAGEELLGLPMEGYWCDLGTPLSYYRCCVDALEGRLRLQPGPAFQTREAPRESAREPEAPVRLRIPCRDRAGLMGRLSELMLELDADFSDGILLRRPGWRLAVRPEEAESALRIEAGAQDTELARSLALSLQEVVRALEDPSGSEK